MLLSAIGVGAAIVPLVLTRLISDPRRVGYVFGPFVLRGIVDVVLASFDAIWQLGQLISLGVAACSADVAGIAAVYYLGGFLLVAADGLSSARPCGADVSRGAIGGVHVVVLGPTVGVAHETHEGERGTGRQQQAADDGDPRCAMRNPCCSCVPPAAPAEYASVWASFGVVLANHLLQRRLRRVLILPISQ